MEKVYISPKTNYLTQEQQRKSTIKYARQLYKNYHDNPNLRIERMTQEDQMKRTEAYSRAIWNSYGKKKSEYEKMQKYAEKRREKLKKAFEKPMEHQVPRRAQETLQAAAGFDGYIIIDKNKERKLSFESAKFRSGKNPGKITFFADPPHLGT